MGWYQGDGRRRLLAVAITESQSVDIFVEYICEDKIFVREKTQPVY
jgi:hypothetical protein